MVRRDRSPSSGFTLLEILLSTVVLGIILIAVAMMTRSCTNMTKALETNRRIEKIKTYYIDYYKENEGMFGTANDDSQITNEFPKDMHKYLEGKLRMDGWGEFFRYYYRTKQTDLNPQDTRVYEITDIAGLLVDGTIAAGVLISYGPNHLKDYTSQTNTPSFPDRPWQVSLQTRGDDMLFPIVVVEEAINIAKTELYCVLRVRLNSYNNFFSSTDNDGDGVLNEDGCVPALGSVGCPPSGGFINDPNCGWATLNNIASYGCPPPRTFPLGFIIANYGLNDRKYRYDPWGHEYIWQGSASMRSGGPNQAAGDIDDVTSQLPEGGCP